MKNHESDAVRIRRANLRDLDALVRLDLALIRYDRTFDPTLSRQWSRTADGTRFLRSRLRGRHGGVWLAESRGTPVGYLVGTLEPAESYRRPCTLGEIECLFVHEKFRGRGIGARLLAAFESWARRAGARRLRVVVSASNQSALVFYEREGFQPYDAVLEKPLRPSEGGGAVRRP